MSDSYVPPEVRGRKPVEVVELPGEIDPAGALEFTYYVKTEGDLAKVTRKIAEEETTGRWIGRGTPTELFHQARAEAVRIEQYDRGDGVVTIRAPLANLDPAADPYYMLQMLSVGGPILEFVDYTEVAFLDFRLPKSFLDRFPGPKWGLKRSRDYAGLGPGDPLIGTIMKPCCGLSVEEVAEKAYQAALGGCTLLKDDEKMMNPSYCPLVPKVESVASALRRAFDETGRRMVYCPHLPVRADKLLDAARRVVDLGATGIMFNVIMANNIGALQIVTESDLDAPIYAHCGGLAALTTGPRRIDARVIAKLARLCGADYFQIGVMGQRDCHVNSLDPSLLRMLAATFLDPIDTTDAGPVAINGTVPVAAGGLGATNLGHNLDAFRRADLGFAVAPLAGSSILDHPHGPRAGALAMWQAARAYQEASITDASALRDWARASGGAELMALFG
ncbi:MAG TPA: RuBisCO large subunit C-terminal-like domain-containing protein [Isosphaeraceae bacterium]|jgi:ribulose-bisphosphate carboxylase large chain|nr:RuBisCO large subunit C-terminal-like domain-containing protein [Isosphaeraceae bacterium]